MAAMTDDSLARLTERLRHFAAERDWEQFHSPKNLAIGVAAEAGELAAEFQGFAIGLDDIGAHLREADIVVAHNGADFFTEQLRYDARGRTAACVESPALVEILP
jgi:hypothetical protein